MKEEINYKDFEKLDIRIGRVAKAEVPEWSHWVMKLTVDFGDLGERTIFSGIMKFYSVEDITGNQYPFVINLKPKRIGPANENGEYEYSQGMMIMSEGDVNISDDDEETSPALFNLVKEVPNGAVVR